MTVFKDSHHVSRTLGSLWLQSLMTILEDSLLWQRFSQKNPSRPLSGKKSHLKTKPELASSCPERPSAKSSRCSVPSLDPLRGGSSLSSLTELFLDWAITSLIYSFTDLLLDGTFPWLNYSLTDLFPDWTVPWLLYSLTEPFLDWTIPWLSYSLIDLFLH